MTTPPPKALLIPRPIHSPQSEINSTITENIVENIVTCQTDTPSQREIFSETGTGTSSSEDMTNSDGDTPEEHSHQTGTQSTNEEGSESRETATSSQSEIFSGYNNNSNNNSDFETYTSSQSEITTEYDASSEPSSREASRPSSPESGNLSVRTVYSPTPEMAIIHRTMHDAIHAIREQQGRAVMRSLLNQQKAIVASKLQCNIQIKRTSTPEHPPMSNVPLRRARARSEKANGVTSGSSEESDCDPQTSRMARFQALKKRLKLQLSLRRKAHLTEHSKGKGFSGKHPPKVPQIARPKSIVLQDPPVD